MWTYRTLAWNLLPPGPHQWLGSGSPLGPSQCQSVVPAVRYVPYCNIDCSSPTCHAFLVYLTL
jgi:hypothetical protein